MATRAMLIRDAFMLQVEPITVRPYMEQGKEDSSHHHSNYYAFMWSINVSLFSLRVTKQCEITEDVRYTST